MTKMIMTTVMMMTMIMMMMMMMGEDGIGDMQDLNMTTVMMVTMMMMRGGLDIEIQDMHTAVTTASPAISGHSGQVNSEFHDSGNLRNFFPAPAFPLNPPLKSFILP